MIYFFFANNKDVHLKLYEEFNIKKRNKEEKNKNTLNSSESKKMDFNIILVNSERLYKDYEKKKNTISKKEINQLKDIKNLSQISLVNKKSNDIISKKLINIYKNEIKSIFNKNISDSFEINYMNYLLLIYKLGLTDKNYNNIIMKNNVKTNSINYFENIYTRYSNQNLENSSYNLSSYRESYSLINEKKQKMRQSFHNNKFRKSLGTKLWNSDIQLKLINDSWKIITKNKKFSEEILALSHNILLFFLCLCGIYKGEKDDFYFKKEFSFLLNDKTNLIGANLAKQIYKLFSPFRNSLIHNTNEKLKTEKKYEKRNGVIKISKSFIKINNYNNNKLVTINNNNKENNSMKKIKNEKNKNENENEKIQKEIYKKNNIKKYLINRIKYKTIKNTANNNNSFKNKNKQINNTNNIKENPDRFKNIKIDEYKHKSKLFSKNIKNKKTLETEIQINKKEKSKNKSVLKIGNIKRELSGNIIDNKALKNNIINDSSKNTILINEYTSNENYKSNINNNGKKKKSKFVFKIKIKDEIIKLNINKNENYELKINEFCKENNLDEEDKQQIFEVVKFKLSEYN